MKTIIFSLMLTLCTHVYGQVSINASGAPPVATSMLDVSSTLSGILIPRMTSMQRDAIGFPGSPATGLMIYNNTTNKYNYYTGTAWVEIASGTLHKIVDADGDTKVDVEPTLDADYITFGIEGNERMALLNNNLELFFPGGSIAIGEAAGATDDGTSNFNTSVGTGAGENLTTGELNVNLGAGAGANNASGSENTFLGYNAGIATDASENVFVGAFSGEGNMTGTSNTFVGWAAGDVNTASNNTFIGKNAGGANTSGTLNTFIGKDAGLANVGGGSNTFVGQAAGDANNGGSNNTFIGQDAGGANFSGASNTFLGHRAGNANTMASNNTFLGATAGLANIGGSANTFVGHGAGDVNDADNNTFIGKDAGGANLSGAGNTFVGQGAGILNNTASNNTFIGKGAGGANTSGTANTFVGQGAGDVNDASNNTFLGQDAGGANTFGSFNTFLGNNAGLSNVSGSSNTFVGQGAGDINTASDNTFIGRNAGGANLSGASNTFIGRDAGLVNSTGASNTFMGHEAGDNNTGSDNTFIGRNSGGANGSGSTNTFIGKDAGTSNTTGANNICLGVGANLNAADLLNSTAIGFNAVVSTNNSMVLGNGVKVGIGISSPTAKIHVVDGIAGSNSYVGIISNTTNNNTDFDNGLLIRAGHNSFSVNQSGMILFQRPDGTTLGGINQNGSTSVAYNLTSDQRLKENIRNSQYGLKDVMKIQVSDYNYRGDSNTEQTGYIAQQLYTILPGVVHVGGDDATTDPWMVDYGRITPLLVRGMQEQQAEIQILQNKIAELVSQMDSLKAMVEEMNNKLE